MLSLSSAVPSSIRLSAASIFTIISLTDISSTVSSTYSPNDTSSSCISHIFDVRAASYPSLTPDKRSLI